MPAHEYQARATLVAVTSLVREGDRMGITMLGTLDEVRRYLREQK